MPRSQDKIARYRPPLVFAHMYLSLSVWFFISKVLIELNIIINRFA